MIPMMASFTTKIQPIALPLWYVLLCLLPLACSDSRTPEHIIIQNLEHLESGIEEKDPDQVLDPLHPNFGTRSGHDRLWIKRTLAFYMLKHTNIEIVASALAIEMEADVAHARFNALVTGGEGLIPQQGAVYQVHTEWRLEGTDWLLVFADWERR